MSLEHFLNRAEELLDRIAAYFPEKNPQIDWSAQAFKWRKKEGCAQLQAIHDVALIAFDDLQHIDLQKEQIRQNTAQFVKGFPANNVLLTGARGTGKSSLVKACLHEYAAEGLRLIEVDKHELQDIQELLDILVVRPERFILYCDDLSFDQGESAYKALKVALDGALSRQTNNVLIYATSNRRHLMPEYFAENEVHLQAQTGEIHPNEAIEEKISLSERFGLWISFHPFRQEAYLSIVSYWLSALGLPKEMLEEAHAEALIWALERGSRSGRMAMQFAKHWVGSQQLLKNKQI